ncbi:putative organic cation/carnitine transporter 4-like [Capsicum annuum]|nr:putative organic cation/carnitine transporter 4-like [Capsicum annuum]KAF3673582.1 putative organic cation/carnitine transporter 4-like [Capsicum annuum]
MVDWPTRMRISIGITKGICFLHTKENIIHGNLTSSNILLDEQNNPKIADVGLSKLMTTAGNNNVIATVGTLGYRVPELSKIKNASTKTDVYSLGVIILELLTGKSPREATDGLDLPQWVAFIVKEDWTNEVFDVELMRDAPNIGDELLNTLKWICTVSIPHQLLSQKLRNSNIYNEASHKHPNQSTPTKLYWPAEILTEILSRLPVKSLLRFKSILKFWSSLISSPEFTKYHLSLSANNNKDYTNHSVMLRIAQPELNLKEYLIMEETNLDYHMKNSGIACVIEGSVNGLICLVNEAKELFLWNPTIRKYKKLPDFRTKSKDDGECTYGFGYDDIHDDYKVVCIFTITRYPCNFQEININSLKDDSW